LEEEKAEKVSEAPPKPKKSTKQRIEEKEVKISNPAGCSES
jgi:hypothetical protein